MNHQRACKFCNKPLPEFIHGSREYCPPPNPEEIIKGARDPKCKQLHAAQKAKTERDEVKAALHALLVNRRLLRAEFLAGNTEIDGSRLLKRCFEYQIATSRVKDKQGQYTIPLYVDYSLEQIGENRYKITYHEPKL